MKSRSPHDLCAALEEAPGEDRPYASDAITLAMFNDYSGHSVLARLSVQHLIEDDTSKNRILALHFSPVYSGGKFAELVEEPTG